MQENTNKAIAINSIILYVKLAIVIVSGLLTTRFALKALGVEDFGLFSVIGSIITFITIFNTIMVATSNRFISIAIGKGDERNVNEEFNKCLVIHIIIAIVTLLVAIPIGIIYINTFLHYSGDKYAAVQVFLLTVIGSVISFIGVPYNGLLIAKEKFLIFSAAEALSHIIKMIIAYLLISHFDSKLLIYAFTQGLLTALPALAYYMFCKKDYSNIIKFKLVKDPSKYKDVLSFSGWIAYGAVATVGKNQGAQLLVNGFFNTTMNTALGLANTVGMFLTTFSNSVAQPIAPQIAKNYASGNFDRCDDLLVMSTKFTYLIMLVISLPFISDMEWILNLWLGDIPNYVAEFSMLFIIDALVTALNSGISNLIFASGEIKRYQVAINTLRLLSIIAAFILLKAGFPVESLLWAYIIFSIIIFFSGQEILHKTMNYNNSILWRRSYLPCLIVTLFVSPFFFIHFEVHAILNICIEEMALAIIIVFGGFNNRERKIYFNKISKLLNR